MNRCRSFSDSVSQNSFLATPSRALDQYKISQNILRDICSRLVDCKKFSNGHFHVPKGNYGIICGCSALIQYVVALMSSANNYRDEAEFQKSYTTSS